MRMAKAVVAALWLVCAASFFLSGESILVLAGRGTFGLLVLVHGIECLVFLPRLKALPGSLSGHLLNTFIYGVLHVQQREAELAAPGSAG